jgi:ubiquinone/menaquinone biosynthesis C-methylase UbiE
MLDNYEETTIQTYDNNAAIWAKQHDFDLSNNVFADALIEFYGLVADGLSVLEVGCGGGRDAAELVKHYNYTGTDASGGMIRAAETNVPDGTFIKCNVYDLSEINKKFDAFWAAAVLLHIPKHRIDEALRSIRAVTTKDAIGMIAIKVGDKEEFEVRDIDGVHEERLFTYWTNEDFTEVLKRNGLDIVSYTFKPVSQRTNWHIYLTRNKS